MIKVGLTGGIGTGKSTVSDILRNEKFKIIDADIIAKEVLEKNPHRIRNGSYTIWIRFL